MNEDLIVTAGEPAQAPEVDFMDDILGD